MSITETATVDAVGIDRQTGEVVLTISDHLDWVDESAHLSALEAKINAYLDYLESGQLDEGMPESTGRRRKIAVFNQFRPTDRATMILENLQQTLAMQGLGFTFGEIPEGY